MKQTLFFVAVLALIAYSCQKETFYPTELSGTAVSYATSERGDSTHVHHCDSLGHHPLDSLGHQHLDSLWHDSLGHHNHPHFPMDSLGHQHPDSLGHVPHDTIPHGGPHGGQQGGGHGGHGGHGGGH
ncbi:MAG: hypothetical protein JNM22_22985 [Saprospiraceae bacterium]|nr:hypothetical protein [Saprospiraceae bacterium]